MAIRVPRSNIGPWAKKMIDECFVSVEPRRDLYQTWISYYYNGSADGGQAIYNRVYSHIDRLASFLYSPTETRFILQADAAEPAQVHDLMQLGNRRLNSEINRTNTDLAFASALNWALVKGCCLVKQCWESDGLAPYVIQPELFGVLREDLADLDKQEAFCEATYLTKSAFERTLGDEMDPRERNRLLDIADAYLKPHADDNPLAKDYLLNIVVGGVNPVSTVTSQGNAMVQISSTPMAMLAKTVAARLLRVDELWVLDKEKKDWVTIRMLGDEPVGGELKLVNAGFVEHEHPYTKVCPNETEGYFWGMSEVAQIYKLQERLNSQIDTLQKVTSLKADPPKAFVGFTGITEQKYNALRTPGGYIYEENPNAKVQALPPEVPPELLIETIRETVNYFDDTAGFTPILMGQGETGVRSQAQASTLARNSSPRMRDRALLVERQCVELGEFSLKLMTAKEAELRKTEMGQTMLLANLFQYDFNTSIDAHSSSPAFQEDARNLAIMLRRLGVIDDESTLMLTHPPHEDTLILKAKQKAAAQAQLMAQHPELALGKKPGPGKGK